SGCKSTAFCRNNRALWRIFLFSESEDLSCQEYLLRGVIFSFYISPYEEGKIFFEERKNFFREGIIFIGQNIFQLSCEIRL
ncbi:MAG: hypothetical protein J5814_10565, partial [Bacteroidaceae bacterium]|nr:hypothetical protein [Bacteroidaceae bacterium]